MKRISNKDLTFSQSYRPEALKLVLSIGAAHVEFCLCQHDESSEMVEVGLTVFRPYIDYSLCCGTGALGLTGTLENMWYCDGSVFSLIEDLNALVEGNLNEEKQYGFRGASPLTIKLVPAGKVSNCMSGCCDYLVDGPKDYRGQDRVELVAWNVEIEEVYPRFRKGNASFVELCGKDAEYFMDYLRLATGELGSNSPEIREMIDADILIEAAAEAKTKHDEEKIVQAVAVARENDYCREFYDEAPSEGCKRDIALSFYYTNSLDESFKVNLADIKLERRRLEAHYGIADWKYLGRHCGVNPLRCYYYCKVKELETMESGEDDE